MKYLTTNWMLKSKCIRVAAPVDGSDSVARPIRSSVVDTVSDLFPGTCNNYVRRVSVTTDHRRQYARHFYSRGSRRASTGI